jgi:hypothetical protein
MAFATGALGAAAGMTRGAFDERAAQDLASGGETFEDAHELGCLLVCHS